MITIWFFFFLSFLIYFYCCSSTVVSVFSPHLPPTPPIPTSYSRSYPFWLCPCVLYIYFLRRLPLFSPIISVPSPLWLLSVRSLLQSLVIFCSLVCFVDSVPIKGEIIWYVSFTTWLISLSLMLSSSIMLSRRVGAPSFFLLPTIPLCKCTTVFWSTHLLMGT